MWVLEKLVEKDEAARQGVGDPAVFLNEGDAEDEEARVAEFIAEGKGADALEQFMDNNLATAAQHHEEMDDFDLLFGDYSGAPAIPEITSTAEPEPRGFIRIHLPIQAECFVDWATRRWGFLMPVLTSRMEIAIFALSCPMTCGQRTRWATLAIAMWMSALCQ